MTPGSSADDSIVFPRSSRSPWRSHDGYLVLIAFVLAAFVGAVDDGQAGVAVGALVCAGVGAAAWWWLCATFRSSEWTGRLRVDATELVADSYDSGRSDASWTDLTRLEVRSGSRFPSLGVIGGHQWPAVRWYTDLPQPVTVDLPMQGRRAQAELVAVLRAHCDSRDIPFRHRRTLGWRLGI